MTTETLELDDLEAILKQNRRELRARQAQQTPTDSPALSIYGCPGTHHLRVYSPCRRYPHKKPPGGVRIELRRALTDSPYGAYFQDAQPVGTFGRMTFVVEYKREDDGKVATYWARWLNKRGEPGPWSLPESFRIAA